MRYRANTRLGDDWPDAELDGLLEAALICVEIRKIAFELCWNRIVWDIENHLATI